MNQTLAGLDGKSYANKNGCQVCKAKTQLHFMQTHVDNDVFFAEMLVSFPTLTGLSTKGTFGRNSRKLVETIPSCIQKFRWNCMHDFLLKGLPEKEVSFCGSVAT